MHQGLITYLDKHRSKIQGKSLEVGSLIVKKNPRKTPKTIKDEFEIEIGCDMQEGLNVDLVCKGEDLPNEFPEGHFDVIVCMDTLEHVENWREFLHGLWHVLKNDGYLIMSIAGCGKGRHNYPSDYWRINEAICLDIFEYNYILNYENILKGKSRVLSTAWCVQKKTPRLSLEGKHLIPIDSKVPEELLEGNPYDPLR
jgi:SAM-dependent methyltransferase